MIPLSADDRAQVQQDATDQFWQHIRPIVQIALAIHVLLLALFVVLDVPALYYGNAASVAAYVVCLLAIARQHFRVAGVLMCAEIILHAALATWVLGWNSNFHFYLFCIVPIMAFSFQAAPVRRVALSGAVLAVAVGGFALRRQMGQQTPLTADMLDILGIANALIATLLLMQTTRLSVRYTRSMHYHLFERASRDSLTNLYTRRRVLQRVPQLLPGSPVTVLMLDIDHFKAINDQYGHDQGDQVLQEVAAAINDSVRVTDMASRWGGEEFMVLMPDTQLIEAQRVAERIQLRLHQVLLGSDAEAQAVTATLAVAQMHEGEDFLGVVKRADQALYLGKQQGRDRIMLAL